MRKRLFLKTLLALASSGGAAACLAQGGDRSVEWVHPFPVGGGSDVIARKLAESMSAQMGRGFFVSNRPGGATNIAAAYVANAKAQGNMVFTGDFTTLAANPHLFASLPYDSAKDFAPAGLYARYPILLVVSSEVPATNLAEFLRWAESHPDSANFASSGVGSAQHLAAELFRERTGLKMTHVAYRGGAPAVTDLMAGAVSFALMDASTVVPQMKTGRLKVLGVASPRRMQNFPDIPTLDEQGLAGFEAFAWQGMLVPAGTSGATVEALNRALGAALASQPVKDFFASIAVEPWFSSPGEMASFVARENERWGKIIRERGITLQ